MKTLTYNEVLTVLSADNFANAELQQNGQKVGKMPKIGVKPAQWWAAEVLKLTQSPTFEPGTYSLVLFYDRAKKNKGKVLNVTLNKNESVGMSQPGVQNPIVIEKSPDVLSYDQAINYVKRVAELENEVNTLTAQLETVTKERDDLKAELDEIEFVDDETPGTMSEQQPQNVIKQMVETAIPVMDKHYEYKEKELNFKLMQFYQQNPHLAPDAIKQKMFPNGQPQQPTHQTPNPQAQPPAQNREAQFMERVQVFFGQLQQAAPEVYNQVLPVFEQSPDMQTFMVSLMQQYPQVYEPLIQFTTQP